MTPRTIRKAERGVHLLWGLILVLSVYGLLPAWGEAAVRWAVIPGIAASGFAMWLAAPLRRLARKVPAWPAARAEIRPSTSSVARR